jgi:hypothetical protein
VLGLLARRASALDVVAGVRLVCAALVSCALTACADVLPNQDGPEWHASVVEHRPDPPMSASLHSINGTYGKGCDGKSGDSWSLGLHATAGDSSLDHPPPSVQQGDADCELVITTAITLDGRAHEAQAPSLLQASYPDLPVAFGNPPVFHARAKIEASAADGTIEVTLVLTAEPVVNSEPDGGLLTYTVSAESGLVPAPDYRCDLGGLEIGTDVHNRVRSATGHAILSASMIYGVGYAITAGRLTTYAALDAAYTQDSRAMTSMIPAAEFNLLGADLSTPQVRTLIVANAINGVRAYQAFAATFAPLQIGAATSMGAYDRTDMR